MDNLEQLKITCDESRLLYGRLIETNRALQGKASTLLQASAVLTGFIAAATVAFTDGTTAQIIVLALILTLFAIMVFLAARVWSPKDRTIPFSNDFQTVATRYVKEPHNIVYEQLLSDYATASTATIHNNLRDAKFVRFATYAFEVQILLMAVLASIS